MSLVEWREDGEKGLVRVQVQMCGSALTLILVVFSL